MYKIGFIILAILVLTVKNSLAQLVVVPNGDFETWTNLGTFSVPDNWPSSDLVWHFNGFPTNTVKPDLNSHSGKYSVRLAPDTSGGKIWPSFIASSFVCKKRPKILAFYHSDSLPAFDNAGISVSFTKFNTTTGHSDSLGGIVWTFPKGVHGSFTYEEIEIGWVSADSTLLPDTATIRVLVKSGPTVVPQGHLLIDDVSLLMHNSGINTINQPETLRIYPNPGPGIFYIQNRGEGLDQVIAIEDARGRELRTISGTGIISQSSFDLSGLANGVYFAKCRNAAGITVTRILLQH